MGSTDYGGFRHGLVAHKRRFDFHGAEAMAGYVDYVVHAAKNPDVSVFIAGGGVASEIGAGEARPVIFFEALGILVKRAQHGGPRLIQNKEALACALDRRAFVIDNLGGHTGQRTSRGTGLSGRSTGNRGDHDGSGFGLPPGIHNRAALFANNGVVPLPSSGIDWLTYGTKKAQRGKIVTLGPVISLTDKRTNGGRRGIEGGNAILLNQTPEAIELGPIGSAFIHKRGCASGQRTKDNIRVPGDPADIGGAPINVVIAHIEDPIHGGEDLGEISAGGVNYSLGLASGAGGIEDIERMLTIELLRRADFGAAGREIFPPVIASGFHLRGKLLAFVDDHVLDGGALFQSFIHVLLEGNILSATQAAVGGDDNLGFKILNTRLEGLGGKATKN